MDLTTRRPGSTRGPQDDLKHWWVAECLVKETTTKTKKVILNVFLYFERCAWKKDYSVRWESCWFSICCQMRYCHLSGYMSVSLYVTWNKKTCTSKNELSCPVRRYTVFTHKCRGVWCISLHYIYKDQIK